MNGLFSARNYEDCSEIIKSRAADVLAGCEKIRPTKILICSGGRNSHNCENVIENKISKYASAKYGCPPNYIVTNTKVYQMLESGAVDRGPMGDNEGVKIELLEPNVFEVHGNGNFKILNKELLNEYALQQYDLLLLLICELFYTYENLSSADIYFVHRLIQQITGVITTIDSFERLLADRYETYMAEKEATEKQIAGNYRINIDGLELKKAIIIYKFLTESFNTSCTLEKYEIYEGGE